VNAFVRSRVLQIWLSIVNEKVTDDFCQLLRYVNNNNNNNKQTCIAP